MKLSEGRPRDGETCPKCDQIKTGAMIGATRLDGTRARRCQPCANKGEKHRKLLRGDVKRHYSKNCNTCGRERTVRGKRYTALDGSVHLYLSCAHCNSISKTKSAGGPKQRIASLLKWMKDNPEKSAAAQLRNAGRSNPVRRERMRHIEGSHTPEEWAAVVESQHGLCKFCQKTKKLTRDHIVPITRGGTDYIVNIQGLCHSCNARKQDRLEEELPASFFQERLEA